MDTKDVAKQLADFCKKGDYLTPQQTLYSKDITSVEPMPMGDKSPITEGLDAVLAKGKWWMDNHEIHSMTATGPFVHGDKFAMMFAMDVTFKPTGKRMTGTEVGVYTVSDGKVVREEFFYEAK